MEPKIDKSDAQWRAELTPEQYAVMRQHGAGDLFPRWSGADLEAIRADGKIPKLDRWRARLESGEVALDSLINMAGLQSFSDDQKALDDRVRGLLITAR